MDTVPDGASGGRRARSPPPQTHKAHAGSTARAPARKRLPITDSILGIDAPSHGDAPDDEGGPAAADRESRSAREKSGFDFVPKVVKKTSYAASDGSGVTVVARSALDAEAERPATLRRPDSGAGAGLDDRGTAVTVPVTSPTARPSAALRGRSKKARQARPVEFEEDIAAPGMVVWHADDREQEGDYFRPRGQRARAQAAAAEEQEASEAPSQPDWEEERIAAMVREREEWDRL